jgi:hypothetical protein
MTTTDKSAELTPERIAEIRTRMRTGRYVYISGEIHDELRKAEIEASKHDLPDLLADNDRLREELAAARAAALPESVVEAMAAFGPCADIVTSLTVAADDQMEGMGRHGSVYDRPMSATTIDREALGRLAFESYYNGPYAAGEPFQRVPMDWSTQTNDIGREHWSRAAERLYRLGQATILTRATAASFLRSEANGIETAQDMSLPVEAIREMDARARLLRAAADELDGAIEAEAAKHVRPLDFEDAIRLVREAHEDIDRAFGDTSRAKRRVDAAAWLLTVPGPDVARSISWEDVRAYLRAKGWTLRETSKTRALELWLQTGSDGGPEEPHVWVGFAAGDERDAMVYALTSIGNAEQRSAHAVLADIARGNAPATNAEPLSEEEIERIETDPVGSGLDSIGARRLLATVRAREAEVERLRADLTEAEAVAFHLRERLD